MLLFSHGGKTSSSPPPAGGLTTAIVAVARRRKEDHVVAAVEGHELETPETEQRPRLKRLLETTHLVEKGHGSRGGTTVTRSAIAKRRGWRQNGQGAWFSFSGYSLGLRKPKKEASSWIKNHHRSLFRVYKGPGKTRSTLRPNPSRNSNSKAKHPFLERLAHAQQLPREPPVLSH
jgi:alkylation response protein AidB-like acyl-CoA dehydrogenase